MALSVQVCVVKISDEENGWTTVQGIYASREIAIERLQDDYGRWEPHPNYADTFYGYIEASGQKIEHVLLMMDVES